MRNKLWRARAGVAIAVGVLVGSMLAPGVAGAATPPSAPTGVHAVAGDGQATVGWVAPASNGGSSITGYTVTASDGGLTCTTTDATACVVYGLDSGEPYTFTVTATNAAGTGAPSAASNSVTPAPGAGAFVPLPAPRRIVDSRPGFTTDDGRQQEFGALVGRALPRKIPVAGRVGLPTDVENVVLSVVAATPTGAGYLTVWSCDGTMPTTSSMNFSKGVTLAGTVLTKLGADDGNIGSICVYASTTTHVIIDLPGSLSSSAFAPLDAPGRIADSRTSGSTDDGEEQGFGALRSATMRAIQVAGRVGMDHESPNAVLSVVAVSPTGTGYLTVYPCTATRPATSSMNFTKGVTLANTVLTKLGTGASAGKVCVYTSTTTHLIIDVSGSFTPEAFDALPQPKRIADSRNPSGDTDDDQYRRFGAIPARTSKVIQVSGRVGLDASVKNVVLSLVAVSPPGGGYFTIYPCGTVPSTASMNYTRGVTLANTVITKLSSSGKVCVYSSATTNVVIDVAGALG